MGIEEEIINVGDLVVLSPDFSDASLKSPGLVTRVIVPNEEVEVYWNESFPQEFEYTPQLSKVNQGRK